MDKVTEPLVPAFTKPEIINTRCCKLLPAMLIVTRFNVFVSVAGTPFIGFRQARTSDGRTAVALRANHHLYLRMELTVTLSNIQQKAREFWSVVGKAEVIAFHGQMGSGKTTFIHALCKEKDVKSSVSSPTFSIINDYAYPFGRIYHIDLYRLNNEEEAIRSGVEDCLYSGNICLVEWPEKAPGIFPETTLHVHVDFVDSQTRRLRLGDK